MDEFEGVTMHGAARTRQLFELTPESGKRPLSHNKQHLNSRMRHDRSQTTTLLGQEKPGIKEGVLQGPPFPPTCPPCGSQTPKVRPSYLPCAGDLRTSSGSNVASKATSTNTSSQKLAWPSAPVAVSSSSPASSCSSTVPCSPWATSSSSSA